MKAVELKAVGGLAFQWAYIVLLHVRCGRQPTLHRPPNPGTAGWLCLPQVDICLASLSVAQADGGRDDSLHLNALGLLGRLIEAVPVCLPGLLDGEGMATLTSCLDREGQGEHMQEAAADMLCKVCASGVDGAKERVVETGALPALASMLGSPAPEVRVRSLLALGMLVGGNEGRLAALAAVPGALAAVCRLMRQGDDGDCQHIAGGIFAALARNEGTKDALMAALKGMHEEEDAGAKFV